ncbi:major facilitator superfamily domain-containing protein [Xylaria flabelliformis]|nr:major facilitator superfamily domain-containing protein [Xylaria flabelliformis]
MTSNSIDKKRKHELEENNAYPIEHYEPSQQKLDKAGLPLVPQPTSRKDDPLNWSPALKFAVCIQVSFLAFLGPLASAVINPAFVPLAEAFRITPVEASYELTVFLVFSAAGPLFVLPVANTYGRRPLFLAGSLLAAVTNIAAAYSSSWTGILVTRVFNGIATGWLTALGPPTICDLYFYHERGFYMGIWAFFINNGAHVAPLIGGPIAQNLGWRWCFGIPGYIQLAVTTVIVCSLPETLYSRSMESSDVKERRFLDLLLFPSLLARKRPSLHDFIRPFIVLRYLAVLLPALYYITCLTYGSVLFAATGSVVYKEFYHFSITQTGLILSIPLIIGNLIGEAGAGWFIDRLIYMHAKRHNGERPPEARLDALWLVLLLPIGTIINGICISHSEKSSWVGNAFGMAIANIGFQVSTTVVYAYCTDCYKPQSVEISAVINFFRNIFSGLLSFYALPLAYRIGFQYAWLVFAFINIVLLLPLAVLRWKGQQIRASAWQKPPTFHGDI